MSFKAGVTGPCVIKWVVQVHVLCLLDLNWNSTCAQEMTFHRNVRTELYSIVGPQQGQLKVERQQRLLCDLTGPEPTGGKGQDAITIWQNPARV